MHGDRWQEFAPLTDTERADIMRAAIGYALGDDAIGLARFRERYLSKMGEGPDARAFEVVTAPIGATGTEFAAIVRSIAGGRYARGVPARPARALSGDRCACRRRSRQRAAGTRGRARDPPRAIPTGGRERHPTDATVRKRSRASHAPCRRATRLRRLRPL